MQVKKTQEAFIEALQDPKVIESIANLLVRKLISKSKDTFGLEQTIVKNHVIFSLEEDLDGKYMTSTQIKKALLAINSEWQINTNKLGRALSVDTLTSKMITGYRKYFIKDIVKEITLDKLGIQSAKETKELDDAITASTTKAENDPEDLNVDFENVDFSKKEKKKAMKQRLKDEAEAEANGVPILPSADNKEAEEIPTMSKKEAKKAAKKAKKQAKKDAKKNK